MTHLKEKKIMDEVLINELIMWNVTLISPIVWVEGVNCGLKLTGTVNCGLHFAHIVLCIMKLASSLESATSLPYEISFVISIRCRLNLSSPVEWNVTQKRLYCGL